MLPAIYSMNSVPILNEDSVCKLYDISDKQRSKIRFRFLDELPKGLCFDDADKTETFVNYGNLRIVYGEENLIPIPTDTGLMFIQEKYLSPFKDMPAEEMIITIRYSTDGNPYFAIKFGLILYALVMPYKVITEHFVSELKSLYEASKLALINSKETDNEK